MKKLFVRAIAVAVIGSSLILGSAMAQTAAAPHLDKKLTDQTAAVLGLSSSEVTITNVNRVNITTRSYIAITASGQRYACTISGGVLSLGMTNPPDCRPAATSQG